MTRILLSLTMSLLVVFYLNTARADLGNAKSIAHKTCQKDDAPKLNKRIEDYDIIAGNEAIIAITNIFKGKNLVYSISSRSENKINVVTIDSKTGKIRIKAEARDKFDVFVTAANQCGSVATKFNVLIDEEI